MSGGRARQPAVSALRSGACREFRQVSFQSGRFSALPSVRDEALMKSVAVGTEEEQYGSRVNSPHPVPRRKVGSIPVDIPGEEHDQRQDDQKTQAPHKQGVILQLKDEVEVTV